MVMLFQRDLSVVTRHISNVFKEGELERESVYAKFAYTASDGKTYQVAFYNLDVIISVGYRVKSVQGTRFRQWATRMLRDLLLRRYEDARRIDWLETRVDGMEQEIKQIKGGMNYLVKQLTAPPKQRPTVFGYQVLRSFCANGLVVQSISSALLIRKAKMC